MREAEMWCYNCVIMFWKWRVLPYIFAASSHKSFDLSVEIRPPLASLTQETKSFNVEGADKVHYQLFKKSSEIYHFCEVYKPVS